MGTNGVNGSPNGPDWNSEYNEIKFKPKDVQGTMNIFLQLNEMAEKISKNNDATGDGLINESDVSLYNKLIKNFQNLKDSVTKYRIDHFEKLRNTEVIRPGIMTNACDYYKTIMHTSEYHIKKLTEIGKNVLSGKSAITQEQSDNVSKFNTEASNIEQEYQNTLKNNAFNSSTLNDSKVKCEKYIEDLKSFQQEANNAGQQNYSKQLDDVIKKFNTLNNKISSRIEIAQLAAEANCPEGASSADNAQIITDKIMSGIDLDKAKQTLSTLDKNNSNMIQQWEFDEARPALTELRNQLETSIQKLNKICQSDLNDDEKAVYKKALSKLEKLQNSYYNVIKTDKIGPQFDKNWEKERGIGSYSFGLKQKGSLPTKHLNKILAFYANKDGYIEDQENNKGLQGWIKMNKKNLSDEDIRYLNTQARYRSGILAGGEHASSEELTNRNRNKVIAEFGQEIAQLQKERQERIAHYSDLIGKAQLNALKNDLPEMHKRYMDAIGVDSDIAMDDDE